MVTEKDPIIGKIKNIMVERSWKLKGIHKDATNPPIIYLENGVVQIDPRFTTHA